MNIHINLNVWYLSNIRPAFFHSHWITHISCYTHISRCFYRFIFETKFSECFKYFQVNWKGHPERSKFKTWKYKLREKSVKEGSASPATFSYKTVNNCKVLLTTPVLLCHLFVSLSLLSFTEYLIWLLIHFLRVFTHQSLTFFAAVIQICSSVW